jgi:hypothetical protein
MPAVYCVTRVTVAAWRPRSLPPGTICAAIAFTRTPGVAAVDRYARKPIDPIDGERALLELAAWRVHDRPHVRQQIQALRSVMIAAGELPSALPARPAPLNTGAAVPGSLLHPAPY